MQVVTAKTEAKTDAAKAEGFRRLLDAAAVTGHSGLTNESPEAEEDRADAEDIEAINKLFAWGAK
jgi:hypothetical protein